jgi:starch synthase
MWNPADDPDIAVSYDVDNFDPKYGNKKALRDRLMVQEAYKPIVAFVGRLDYQKGVHLIRHALFHSLDKGAQFVLLGSSTEQGINADFWQIKHELNDHPDCHLEIGYNEELAHLIYAGADILIVPSMFEPCGLTQMIALRYGTVPVVRYVGGLADTIHDRDHSELPPEQRNGYVFHQADSEGLDSALDRAIGLWFDYPEEFQALAKNGMRYDYSWNTAGQNYLNIYEYIRS